MKRKISPSNDIFLKPIAWREEAYAAKLRKAADAFDDRVSDDIFDFEGEHAAVGVIVGIMKHDRNLP